MVERLAEEDLAKYREIFSYFDRDGGGSIGAEELAQVSSWVGGPVPGDEDLRLVPHGGGAQGHGQRDRPGR